MNNIKWIFPEKAMCVKILRIFGILRVQISFPGSLFEPRRLQGRPWDVLQNFRQLFQFSPSSTLTFWAVSITKKYFSISYLERNNGELILVTVKDKKNRFHQTRILPLLFALKPKCTHISNAGASYLNDRFFNGKVLNCKAALNMDVSGHLCLITYYFSKY